jgi:hypothetical protein
MSNPNWETIDVPQGAFVGWGTQAGQHVTGKLLAYSASGGTDFNNEPCPQLTIELIEPAASFNKAGERTDFPAGEIVSLTVGQVGLKNAVARAGVEAGDLIKITLSGTSPTKKGNTIKVFDLKVARGAGQSQRPANAVPQPQAPFQQAQPAAPFQPAQPAAPFQQAQPAAQFQQAAPAQSSPWG